MKLSLTKKYGGFYSKRVGSIQVFVIKNAEAGGWFGCVEIYTHTAKDFEGTNVEMFNELFSYKGDRKKDVYEALKNYLMNHDKY